MRLLSFQRTLSVDGAAYTTSMVYALCVCASGCVLVLDCEVKIARISANFCCCCFVGGLLNLYGERADCLRICCVLV